LQSEHTAETGASDSKSEAHKEEEAKILTSVENKANDLSRAQTQKIKREEVKEEINRTKTAQSKGKQGRKGKGNSVPPKPKKERKCVLPKIELNDSFWKAYDSDYSDSGSDAESIEEYVKDGYHPVHVGETFQGRYRVLKKLGWGAFSTVWFCHDLKMNKFVAVKVQK